MNKGRQGFTLIEILIVVAIIAILASVVLVGLGPTQQAGRDARRLSDIREMQNALELFYNKCGYYPGSISGGACSTAAVTGGTWTGANGLAAMLTASGAGLGISTIPSDPSANRTYGYGVAAGNTTYVVGAALEDANNSVFTGYTAPPGSSADTWIQDSGSGIIAPDHTCSAGAANPTYCVSL